MQQEYQSYYAQLQEQVDTHLERCFTDPATPTALRQAVRYSLLAGGKRLRPVLVLMAADACGAKLESAIPAACAVEMIHTYSLIHDDLPSMDDDVLRRGRPTSHTVYGEALAILAGDTLLTSAFETLATADLPAAVIADCVRILSQASGGAGMVGGQILDLAAERGSFPGVNDDCENPESNRSSCGVSAETPLLANSDSAGEVSSTPDSPDVEQLIRIHRMKTGALITSALEMGAAVAQADDQQQKCLRTYGLCCGLAFQIADDLLDVTGSGDKLGKETGRDIELGKLTYPVLMGVDDSRRRASDLVRQACDGLAVFGDRAEPLRRLAQFIVERDH